MTDDVRLETRRGAFVTYGSHPQFNRRPDVLFWGHRVFAFHGYTFVLAGWRWVPRYREAFAVAIVDANTPRDEVEGFRPYEVDVVHGLLHLLPGEDLPR